jgi:hypothetical protein
MQAAWKGLCILFNGRVLTFRLNTEITPEMIWDFEKPAENEVTRQAIRSVALSHPKTAGGSDTTGYGVRS